MPGFLTDYVNNRVLDHWFGGAITPPPPTLYVGLSLTYCTKGGEIVEPTGGGYARVPIPNTLALFPAAFGGTKANAAPIVFPAPTADWGEAVSLFLADAATGGAILASADLTVPKLIQASEKPPTVAIGALFLSHT